jgi:hypothetical protein
LLDRLDQLNTISGWRVRLARPEQLGRGLLALPLYAELHADTVDERCAVVRAVASPLGRSQMQPEQG